MKTLLAVIAVIAALGAGYRLLGDDTGAAQASELVTASLYVAKRGDLPITVVENGYLKAKNNTEIKPKFNRRSTITWLIEEGEEVEEGTKLAEFEKSDLEAEIEEVKNQLIQTTTELEAAEAELAIQERDAAAQVESAEFAVKMVKLKREKHLEGEGPNQRRKMALAAEKARSDYERAQERFEKIPVLAEQGFYTKLEVEAERISLREAEINLENAEKDFEIWETYTEPMAQAQLEVDLKDAERQLINAREKTQINIKENQARVSRIRSKVTSTEQRLEKQNQDLGYMTITAPAPGIVHYGDPARPWYRDQVKVGSDFYRGNTMFTLPDLREMQVLIQVHESDIDLLELDQVVHVTVEAVRDRIFEGKVTHIASVATSEWMDESNKHFRVEITMEPIEDIELRAGITAKSEIQVETIEDVVQVPIHAVVTEGDQHFVFLPDGESFEKREVEIGKNNSHYVAILEGLEDGEQVYLFDPREADAIERAAAEAKGADEEGGFAAAMGGETAP